LAADTGIAQVDFTVKVRNSEEAQNQSQDIDLHRCVSDRGMQLSIQVICNRIEARAGALRPYPLRAAGSLLRKQINI
jgi:hypothetical protein